MRIDEAPRVLVADDERALARIYEHACVRAGLQIDFVESVAEAQRLLRTRSYACAVLDKNLPDGSGVDLMHLIRTEYPSTQAFLVTAFANLESAVAAVRVGALDYMTKPFDLDELEARLRVALERWRVCKQTDQRIQEADRLAALGTLAAGVAHELNNPLAYICSNLEFVLAELPDLRASLDLIDPALAAKLGEFSGALREAQTGAERATHIVRDLKMFSRRNDQRVKPTNVRRTLESALKMLQVPARVRVLTTFGSVPAVDADESQLGQVFSNLLVNGAQAIPEDAAVAELQVATGTDARGWITVEIRDTGAGIPPDVLNRIFEPFFSTKPVGVGTGLGLSISRSIVLGLGGEITVESQVGKGTLFRVVLPPSRVGTPLLTAKAQKLEAGTSRRVLVVDDDPLIGSALRRTLRRHKLTIVNSGEQALELLSGGDRFDAILCDLMMPGMSGAEVHAQLQRLIPEQAERVIVMTGGALHLEDNRFLDGLPPDRKLSKPFEDCEVELAIQNVA